MRVLILCTGNSCRSQMTHGFLQSFDKDIYVFSAGTHPAEKVNPLAVEVMAEAGMAVVGLSLPEATLLKKVMTWKLVGLFFGLITLFIVILGYLYNIIL